jgi:uncharacterized DUF497 family protein
LNDLTIPYGVATKNSVDAPPEYDWDDAKRAANIRAHKVDFTALNAFDWDTAYVEIDDREDYGELREVAIGFIGARLHVLIFTRRAKRIRVISLWKAQKSDMRRYAESLR